MILLLKKSNTSLLLISLIATQILSSCMPQDPAPIEFKSGVLKNDTSKYVISEEDNDITYAEIKNIPSKAEPKEYLFEEDVVNNSASKKEEEQKPTLAEKEAPPKLVEKKPDIKEVQKPAKNKTISEKTSQNLDDELNSIFTDSGADPKIDTSPAQDLAKEPYSAPTAPNIPEGLTNSLIKPVDGKILKGFDSTNQGINIAADMGTPVKSVYGGQVVYSGYDSKFGNLVITKLNEGDFYAAFAHLDDLSLVKGQQIMQGEIIGHVGQSGNVSAPQLYMAIKKGKIAIDPAQYFNY